jgi:hypothetical protein
MSIFEEARKAFHEDFPLLSNPYIPDSIEFRAWHDGWVFELKQEFAKWNKKVSI